MPAYADGRWVDRQRREFADLNRISTIIGANGFLFPFLESVGTVVQSYGQALATLTPSDEAAARALEAEFIPHKHENGGIFSYYNDGANNNHLAGADLAGYSFGNGTVDSPFSLGIWVSPRSISALQSLIAKYRTTAVAAREYDFRITAAGLLAIEFFDESAAASEIGTGATALTLNQWSFACMTYDGDETNPLAQLYLNGVADGAGATTETGAYVAMENTATPLLIAARDLTGSPAQELDARFALPFIAASQLSAAQVAELYEIGRRLLSV